MNTKQYFNIGQMQHLKELGVDTSKGTMYYWIIRNGEYVKSKETYVFPEEPTSINLELHPYNFMFDSAIRRVECIAAFTFQDIFELLPKKLPTKDGKPVAFLEIIYPNDDVWEVSYGRLGYVSDCEFNENLIDAAFEMLCWVI